MGRSVVLRSEQPYRTEQQHRRDTGAFYLKAIGFYRRAALGNPEARSRAWLLRQARDMLALAAEHRRLAGAVVPG